MVSSALTKTPRLRTTVACLITLTQTHLVLSHWIILRSSAAVPNHNTSVFSAFSFDAHQWQTSIPDSTLISINLASAGLYDVGHCRRINGSEVDDVQNRSKTPSTFSMNLFGLITDACRTPHDGKVTSEYDELNRTICDSRGSSRAIGAACQIFWTVTAWRPSEWCGRRCHSSMLFCRMHTDDCCFHRMKQAIHWLNRWHAVDVGSWHDPVVYYQQSSRQPSIWN